MHKPRIVFMGTPEFAVPSLQALIDRRENPAAVVTQPDRPAGRGRRLQPSPVKRMAQQHGICVLQPESARDPAFLRSLQQLEPDLAVVVAYGQILPRNILDIPPLGSVNVHSSLLPAYRGAAPINWAIINGEARSGVTIMLLDEGMDTGPVLLQESTAIQPEETAACLHDRLAVLGAKLLAQSLDLLAAGGWKPVAQDHRQASYAPMLKKSDGRISWQHSALKIANQIRGMTPWPGCFSYLDGHLLKIHRARARENLPDKAPGGIVSASREGILVAAGRGSLMLTEVQIEGKNRTTAEAFIQGHPLKPGSCFSDTP